MATLYVDVYSGTKKRTSIKYGSSEYLKLLSDGYKLTSTSKRKVESAGLYSGTSVSRVTSSGSTPTRTTTSSTGSSSSTTTNAQMAAQLAAAKAALDKIQASQTSSTATKSSYTGNSIVDYLSSIGMDSSQANRAKLASQYGISNYDYSAAKNTELLNAMRNSSLGSSTSTSTTSGSTSSGGTNTSGMSLKDLSTGMVSGTVKTQEDVNSYKAPGSSYSGGPYNMSQYGLVRFSGAGPQGYMNDNIVWLVDPQNGTLRPFESERALRNFFDGEVDINTITVVDAQELAPGGTFGGNGSGGGFQVLSNDYAIKRDGTARQLDYSNSQLSTRYGMGVNEELEQTMYSALKGMFTLLEGAGISSSTISKIKSNDSQLAFYVSALAYGGYSVGDIYSDVKKRELGIDDLAPISATATKQQYVSTNEYQEASSNNKIAPPQELGGLNGKQLDLPVYQLPDEAFKTLIPILDYDSQEFQDAMDKIETSYYDVLQQQLNASTEQEKSIADYNYEQWKAEVEGNLGIQLSNNALEAWNQVEQAMGQFAQRGISGSGIQNEEIDSYLQRVRRDDQIMRDQVTDTKEKERMNYFLTAASESEIKALVDSEPDLAKRWGLVPSDDVLSSLNLNTLKEKYPNAKEEDLAQYISILLDENGNYRSSLYQKQMGSLLDLNPGSASLNTTTGIGTAKEQFQRAEALRKSLLEEEEAYKEFTTPDTAFLRNDPDEKLYKSVTGTDKYQETDLSSILRKASGNLYSSGGITGKANTSGTTPTTTTQTPPPTSSQLSTYKNNLQTAQNNLNTIGANSAGAGTNTYTPPKITTPTTVTQSTGPSDALKQMSIANSPVYNPNQNNVFGTGSNTTANSTPAAATGNSTIGGTLKSIWDKLSFWN